jgi:hypothetical protein
MKGKLLPAIMRNILGSATMMILAFSESGSWPCTNTNDFTPALSSASSSSNRRPMEDEKEHRSKKEAWQMNTKKALTLAPLKFKDAVASLLQVKPPKAKQKAKRPKLKHRKTASKRAS